jgi:hypothetical protein
MIALPQLALISLLLHCSGSGFYGGDVITHPTTFGSYTHFDTNAYAVPCINDDSNSLIKSLQASTQLRTPRNTERSVASLMNSLPWLRSKIASRGPHVSPVWCPASHFADLQLIHGPCAKVRAATRSLRERRERKGDALCGTALSPWRATVCRVEKRTV